MKKFGKMAAAITLTALLTAGCGAQKAPAETAAEAVTEQTEAAGERDGSTETEEMPAAESGTADGKAETAEEMLAPDPTNLTYLEEYQIADFYGDGKEYALYAPKGGENTDGFFYADDHGVTFTASVYAGGSLENLQMYLEETVKLQAQDWQDDPECTEVGVGEVLEKGDDRYLFLTAKSTDIYGTPYQRTKLLYMSVREGGVGVFWDMEVREYAQDEETAPMIQEVARCYGLNLGELAMEDGTWSEENAEMEADRQDVYEPEEGDPVLEKVEGYEYLGMLTLALDDEGTVTCPVLVPMGWNTTADANRVSTTIHGVAVRASGYHTGSATNFQAMVQEEADWDLKYYSDPEQGCRNVQISKIMPMQGQDAGVFYILEYEEQDYRTEEYYKRTDITCMMQVKEKHFVTCDISLKTVDFDGRTNSLIKELETAYGLDLSAYYAQEDVQ